MDAEIIWHSLRQNLSVSNIHGTYNITVLAEYSTVQSSNKIQIIFYFYPRPLQERESTDGHFLLLLQLFPTSNFLFLPGWKNTSFIPTRDPWPTRHDLTSSPSYVITSVCDSFSDRISNLICIVVNNHCVSFHHDPLGVLSQVRRSATYTVCISFHHDPIGVFSHAFSSETQRHLYCLCKLPSRPDRCVFSCFLKWDAAPPILSVQ